MAAAAVRKAQATSPPRKVTVEAFKLEFAGWEFIADSFFALLAQFKSENIKKKLAFHHALRLNLGMKLAVILNQHCLKRMLL